MALEDTKNAIINVASKLFSRFGFHKTSMDEIARLARKAKGSLYYHFPSKEDLFKEVVGKEFEYLKASLLQVVNDPALSPKEKLKKYLLKRMEILSESKNYHETLQADFYEHFSFLDELRLELTQWEKQQIKKIIDEGIKAGVFITYFNTDVAIDVFMLVLRGLEVPFFLQNQFSRYAPHFDDLLTVITRGISV